MQTASGKATAMDAPDYAGHLKLLNNENISSVETVEIIDCAKITK